MSSDDAGVSASTAGDEGFSLVGKGGKPVSPKSASAGSTPAPAPAYADVVAGLASSAPSNALVAAPTPAGGKRASAKPRSKSPTRPGESDMHAELLAAIANLAASMQGVTERVSSLEGESRGRGASDNDDPSSDGSESGSDSSSTESSEQLSSTDDEGDSKSYIRVPRKLGHWNCKELEANVDQQPRRYSLHGYEPFDELQSTKHGGGGTLGLGLRWMKPTCLYFKTGLHGLKNSLKRMDELRDDVRAGGEPPTRAELTDLRSELMASYNTLAGAFELGNTYQPERNQHC